MNRRGAGLAAGVGTLTLALAIPAYGYVGASSALTTRVTARSLTSPGSSYESADDAVAWQVTPGAGNPVTTRYTVTRGATQVCQLTHTGGTCPADTIGAAAAVNYTVAAELGTHWRAATAPVEAFTPPPEPTVTLATGSDTGIPDDGITSSTEPHVVVSASPGVSEYGAQLLRRELPGGDFAQFAERTVSGGTALNWDEAVALTGAGDFEVKVRTTFHGLTAESGVLTVHVVTGQAKATSFTVSNGGTSGHVDNGDTLTVHYDRPLDPRSICGNWAATSGNGSTLTGVLAEVGQSGGWTGDGGLNQALTLSPPSGGCGSGGSDVIRLGTFYLLGGGACAFPNSTLEISTNWKRVHLTLGGGTESCPLNPVEPTSVAPGYVPSSPNPTDHAGNSLDTTPLRAEGDGW